MARDGRLQRLLNQGASAMGAAAPAPGAAPQGSLRVMSAASMAQLMGAIAPVIDTFSGPVPNTRASTATAGTASVTGGTGDINPAVRAVTQLLATVGSLSPTDQQTVMNMIPDTIALASRGYQAAAAPVGAQLFDTMSQFAQQMTTFSAATPAAAPTVAPWISMLGNLARTLARSAPSPESTTTTAGHAAASHAAPGPTSASLQDVARQLSALTDQMVAESLKSAPAPAPKKE